MIDSWSQAVIKSTSDSVDSITEAPQSNTYRKRTGTCRSEGIDCGILVTRGRFITDNFGLTEKSKR